MADNAMAKEVKKIKAAVMSAAKYVFWILGALFVLGASYYIYNVMARPVAGILVFMGGVLALYFYYVKWFLIPEMRPAWPPYQTVCPDYLTPVSPGYDMVKNVDGKEIAQPKNQGKFKCVDFVGVSRNGNLKRATPTQLQSQLLNPSYVFEIDPSEKPEALRARLQNRGLSWITMFGDN
jgi:hypothetical protein